MADDNDPVVSFDTTRLGTYLNGELGPVSSYDLTPLGHGHSNETYALSWGEQDLVLRKPPPGATSDSAHDIIREYRVMSALSPTPIPVPETVLACDDVDVVGSDFYIMERLKGDVIRETEPDRFETSARRQEIGNELVDVLASIHTVDYNKVGLGDLGRAEGYLDRQIDRWRRQVDWAFETTDEERPVDELGRVHDWLAANVPSESRHTLVHGDFKLDNVMFSPGPVPAIAGVFDWEMSTLGDPLADLGWLLLHWHQPTDTGPIIPSANPPFLAKDGYPSRRGLVEQYERSTGTGSNNLRFYRVLAAYKQAAACEVFFARHLLGSEDPLYATMRDRVPRIADRATAIIEGQEPL